MVRGSIDLTVEQAVTGITVTGSPALLRGIGVTRSLSASAVDGNGQPVVGRGISWASGGDSVVTVTPAGVITTTGPGVADVRASADGITSRFPIEVVRQRSLSIDPFLGTPAAGALWVIPVIIVAYLPSADGVNIDVGKSPDYWALGAISLDSVEQRMLDYSRRRKMLVEEGSRFRGYKNATALPSIGYRVVAQILVYGDVPASTRRWTSIPGEPRFTDWFRVFADLNLAELMEQNAVKEVWFGMGPFDASYPSYDPKVHRLEDMRIDFESNMASPITGDISNSFRWNDDLPMLRHTYVTYLVNWRRSQAEATHNVGHQLEAQLSYVNTRQDGNSWLFWRQFVGKDSLDHFIAGRAGWTHMPPNTTVDYDYSNPTPVLSDIEDWRSDETGQRTAVSSATWTDILYPWPGPGAVGQRAESHWYAYWMQNFPGRGNQIPHSGQWMTNWWAFVGDWDGSIQSGLGLYSPQPAASSGGGVAMSSRRMPEGAAVRWPVPEVAAR